MSDFFVNHVGTAPNFYSSTRRKLGSVADPIIDLAIWAQGIRVIDRTTIPRRILVVGIEVPSRAGDIHKVLKRIKNTSNHSITSSTIPMAQGLGKFANISRCLNGISVDEYDWLIVVDDDIHFGNNMFDRFIRLSELADLSLSQPAHVCSSNASYSITMRKPKSFVRETHFVEIGPVTAISRKVYPHLLPFPHSRWCYGIDLLWSELARANSFKMGIVDAAPIRHLRGVGSGYSLDEARAEGEALLRDLNMSRTRADVLGYERVLPIRELKRVARHA